MTQIHDVIRDLKQHDAVMGGGGHWQNVYLAVIMLH